jgi:phospholipase C
MSKEDPIKHVIVLMLENNSFDHLLGSLTQLKNGMDGVPANSPFSNSYSGASYTQSPNDERLVTPDPQHDLQDVLVQIREDAQGNAMSGFVENYCESYPKIAGNMQQIGQVMNYYSPNSLPALHTLALEFAVCDHWFSSLPGPTWPNRLFAMTGTSLGRVTMPSGIMDLNLHWYDQSTVFDRLNEQGVSWKVYFGDIAVSMILVHQWEPQNAIRHRPMLEFFFDAASTDSDKFPEFVWIEPSYLPPRADDYHPPHDVYDGEDLVRRIYNALRANDALWNSSLLIVLFDEHGGFYDHVSPPAGTPPDHHQEDWTFDRLGVRVPAILVSPWVENTVINEVYDHTSLLRYVTDKWKLGPLGQRTANANSFASSISTVSRTDTPEQLAPPPLSTPVQQIPIQSLTDHESSMIALSHALESMAGEDASVVAARSTQVLSGPASQVDAAVDRVEAFLRHRSSLFMKL